MTLNTQFSGLFVLILCFASHSSTIRADARETCGLEKKDLGTFVRVPSGLFIKNKKPMYPEEGKPTSTKVNSFEIQSHEVTNSQFQEFITETGYVTEAERSQRQNRADSGSAVFSVLAKPERGKRTTTRKAPGWRLISGATWKSPLGPNTNIEGKDYFPVVHVSMKDAEAYASWSNTRIPTENEWEYAASLGLIDSQNQTSGAYNKEGNPIANTWQGIFPSLNSVVDGFLEAAPVGCYQPTAIGLFDMIGNIWEWTDTPLDSRTNVIKGGSFLCSHDFCKRFRPSARQFQEKDFSTNHLGFRVVRDIGEDEKNLQLLVK